MASSAIFTDALSPATDYSPSISITSRPL
jgi:hypothetical protein